MKTTYVKFWSKLFAATLLFHFTTSEGLRSNLGIPMASSNRAGLREVKHDHMISKDASNKGLMMDMIYATGSSLPDCSHACGPCVPCKRVMVSFKCSVAMSCPIVYRCMCRGKFYQVPSN